MSSGSQLAWLSVALHTTAGVREFLGYLANLLAELESPTAWQLLTSSLQLPLLLLTPATVLLPALGVTPSLPSQPFPDLTVPTFSHLRFLLRYHLASQTHWTTWFLPCHLFTNHTFYSKDNLTVFSL